MAIKIADDDVIHDLRLKPELVEVWEDGVLGLAEAAVTAEDALVSMSLFGRNYNLDPPYPDQFCPAPQTHLI